MIERVSQNEAQFTDVIMLLTWLHGENGFCPFNLEKAAENVHHVIGEGMTWMARDGAGKPIGVLGLVEDTFWYGNLTFLVSAWFYVRPEHRFGRVGVELMRRARDEAEKRGLMVFIETSNPRRKAKAGWATVAMERAGFAPAGYMLRLGGEGHVREQQHQTDTEN